MNGEKKAQKKIGKYEIISKIAQGGMGALYKAKHPTLGRIVLLKKLSLRGGEQFVERFKREARLMMDFKNEHIAQVYDHFKEGAQYYIVEEYVDGISLDALIKKERYLSNDASMLILYETAKALKYAHDKQVIHRDIKPANILISREGEVKLVDFGIATSLQESDDGLTHEGMMLGTPAYIPPEQIEDAKGVDRRADIYSLGAVVYEMLTGRPPFPGTFTAETINLIVKGRYTAPLRFNPKASKLLVKIARRAMRVKRKRRFQDLRDIIRILEKRIKRRDAASIRQAMKNILQNKDIKELFKRRRAWLAWLISLALLAGILAGAGYYLEQEGYYYEYLRSDSCGALMVSAPSQAAYQSALYRENGASLTPLPGVDMSLRAVPEGKAGGPAFETKRIYLEAGRYRLCVGLEGQISWYSFTIEPRIVQKQLLSTQDGLRVRVAQAAGIPTPLDLGYVVKDGDSGADITASTQVSIFVNGRGVIAYGQTGGEVLMTGAAYRFQFVKDGYFPQSYDIPVGPNQRVLRIDARLVPRPGTLVLRSTANGLSLLLNDSAAYFSGGLERKLKRLEPLGAETRRIPLSPGIYTLSMTRGSASQRVSVRLSPDKSSFVDISFDASRNALSASVKE
jgi:hypothetical protein